MVALFCVGGRDVADRLEGAAVVVPVHPVEGGELDSLQVAPRAAPPDHLGLEQPDDGLGERVVVAVTDAADGGLDAGLKRAFRVANRKVLPAPVAMMDEADRKSVV